MLMLEHTGRRSGLRRFVVLEVIAHREPGRWVVASGFGTRAQWYRNVIAEPAVRVVAGPHGPRDACARPLPADEADAALAVYVARHPRAWAALSTVVEHTLGAPVTTRDTALPLVELRLVGRGG